MTKILKRLEIIKNSIALEDEEIVEFQVSKLSQQKLDSDVEKIVTRLKKMDYSVAVLEIEAYLKRRNDLVEYIDSEVQGLKLELKALEKRLQALAEKKAVLKYKKFQENKNEVAALKKKLQTLVDEFDEEDLFTDKHNEFCEETSRLEQELQQKEKDLKKVKEEYKKDEDVKSYEEAKADYESFDEEYQEVVKEKRYELDDESINLLKQAYKKTVRLCHPDIVPDELKEQAHTLIQQLNVAYSTRDLQKVQEILHSLESGRGFEVASDTINDKELLKEKIDDIKIKIDETKEEIETLKEDDTFKTINDLDDWDKYFEELKAQLQDEKDKLEDEARGVLENISELEEEIEEWIRNLWDWADRNSVPDCIYNKQIKGYIGIPRNKIDLLDCKTLILSGNNLDFLPSSLFKLTQLKELIASANNLTEIPSAIKQLVNLEKLVLGEVDNPIIDDEFRGYEDGSNNLQVLPKEIGSLKKLKILDVTLNQLSTLPQEIGELQSLEELVLAANSLEDLPKTIINLQKLKYLDITGNFGLVFSPEQIQWIEELKNFGCKVNIDYNLFQHNNDVKMPFMSNKYDGLLIDINDIKKLEIINNKLYIRLKNNDSKFVYEYKSENYAFEDKDYYERILKNPLAAVILIANNGQLKAYGKDSEEYIELIKGFGYEMGSEIENFNEENILNNISVTSENSNYSKHIHAIEVPTFEKIRRYCQNLVDENEADEMQKYLAENGKMYKALIYSAIETFIEKLDGETITLVDWGCDQGIGSMLVLDYIREKQLDIKVEKIFLLAENVLRAFENVNALKQQNTTIFASNMVTKEYYIEEELNSNDTYVLKEFNNSINDSLLHLFVNTCCYIGFYEEDWYDYDFEIFNGYFLCVSTNNSIEIEDLGKHLSKSLSKNVHCISKRDCKIGKFHRFERIFKI